MEWQQIIGFYHVVKQGSFTKAAEATFRCQSAISLQVKSLENELGCQLFERIGRRKIGLTLAGEKLFQHAVLLMDQQNNFFSELNEIKALNIGRLRLAAPFYSLYYLALAPIKKFTRQYPKVEITVLDRPPQSVIQLVGEGDIDLGICMESIVPKNLTTLPWVRIECLLIVPTGHPLTKLNSFEFQDIAKYPFILPPKNLHYTAGKRFEEKLRQEGTPYRIAMESSNIELTTRYVKMGFGIAFVCVEKNLKVLKQKGITTISLERYFKPDNLVVILRKNKALNFYEKAFIDHLFEASSRLFDLSSLPQLGVDAH